MDPRQSIQRWTRFMGLALIVATLPACQKNRLSSVPPQQPAYRPGGYPPGIIPGHPNPGIYVPPTQPPIVEQPPVVIPPRVTPPTPVPPHVTPPDVTPPGTIPSNPGGGSIVTPLPSNPTPTYPSNPSYPTTPNAPVVVAPPAQNYPSPTYPQPQLPSGPTVVVPPTATTPTTPAIVYPPAPSAPVAQPTPSTPVTQTPGGSATGSVPMTTVTVIPQYGGPEVKVPVAAFPGSNQPVSVVASNGNSIQVGRSGGVVTPPAAKPAGTQVIVNVPQPAPAPIVRNTPNLPSGVRAEIPQQSGILATCRGADCYPKSQTYMPQQDVRLSSLSCPPDSISPTPITNHVDVLFVIDTSASMKQERVDIAKQLARYVEQIRPEVVYRIGVMLGHGPRSKVAQVGEIFSSNRKYGVIFLRSLMEANQFQNDRNVRTVHQRTGHGGYDGLGSAEALQAGIVAGAAQAAARLAEMMQNVPNDTSETQGEAGLLNLYTAVTNPRKLGEMKERGIWNDNAAKHVIFVADENDVCFDYVKAGLKGNYNTDKDRRNEQDAFNRTDVCTATANGRRLTPEAVFDAVRASSQMPVYFSGILYTSAQSYAGKRDKYAKDNEEGRGYLEVIGKGFGQAIDLSQKNFGDVLAKLGHYSDFKSRADHVFQMDGVTNVNEIDPLTVRVVITDPSGASNTFNATNVKLHVDPHANKAQVIIGYEVLAQVYANGEVKQGSKVQIFWGPKPGATSAQAQKATTAASAPAARSRETPAGAADSGSARSDHRADDSSASSPVADGPRSAGPSSSAGEGKEETPWEKLKRVFQ